VVQIGPMKPTLKAPGSRRLKLEYNEVPSNFAFKSNLRCYDKEVVGDDEYYSDDNDQDH
jgi:hypothetical protein